MSELHFQRINSFLFLNLKSLFLIYNIIQSFKDCRIIIRLCRKQ